MTVTHKSRKDIRKFIVRIMVLHCTRPIRTFTTREWIERTVGNVIERPIIFFLFRIEYVSSCGEYFYFLIEQSARTQRNALQPFHFIILWSRCDAIIIIASAHDILCENLFTLAASSDGEWIVWKFFQPSNESGELICSAEIYFLPIGIARNWSCCFICFILWSHNEFRGWYPSTHRFPLARFDYTCATICCRQSCRWNGITIQQQWRLIVCKTNKIM